MCLGKKQVGTDIARADVVAFLLEQAPDMTWLRQAPSMSSGNGAREVCYPCLRFSRRCVATLGAGLPRIDVSHGSIETLAEALAKASGSGIRSRVRDLGSTIHAEGSVGEAARLVE